jgi:GntR family transcriptional regulator
MDKINLDSSTPLYIQIKDRIKEHVLTGRLKRGEKIPSERELCEMFGVSRITARQAIAEAINEGLLFTVQGKGTYVCQDADNKIDQGLVRITSFQSTLKSKGFEAGTKILGYSVQPADLGICRILNLNDNDHVLSLDLLGTADGQPIVLYRSRFERSIGLEIYKNAVEKERKGCAFSTIDLYKGSAISQPNYMDQTFEAVLADRFLAETMKIDEGFPMFLITSIMYDSADWPIEYRKAYYRADKYKFNIRRGV